MSNNRFAELVLCALNTLIARTNTIINLLGATGGGALLASGTSGSIVGSTPTTVVSYTNSTGEEQRITLVSATGTSDAGFELQIDSATFVKDRNTSEQQRNVIYRPPKGFKLADGSTMTLIVTHFKGTNQTFTGEIIGV